MARHMLMLLGAFVMAVSASALTTPHGLYYLGVGYDILRGNPEGGDLSSGGVDPGLHISHRVFKLTYDENKKSNDELYDIPDEATFIHRSSAARSSSKKTFSGTASYVDKLSTQVEVSVESDIFFASTKFAASHQYEQVNKTTSESGYVYSSEELVENLGHARLKTELAEVLKFPLAEGFVVTVCNLPAEYDERIYMNFLKGWGTHIVVEVDLGTRDVKTYREKRSKVMSDVATNHIGDVSIEGAFKGTTVSLSAGVENYLQEASSEDHLGEEFSSFTIGSKELKEPIGYKLMGMNEILQDSYWALESEYVELKLCASGWPRAAIQENVITALRNYAAYSNVAPSKDEPFRVPLAWPRGTYALPGRDIPGVEHCPSTEHLTFAFGTRHQHTEDTGSNTCSPSLREHMTTKITSNTITHPFCVKEVSEIEPDAVWDFGKGSYCIMKKGDCPEGFWFAYIKFDDEDTYNKNAKTGTLPDGDYDHNSSFYYCCRKDGDVKQPLILPVAKPFYLFANTANCQKVLGMSVTQEFIAVNTQNHDNWDSQAGNHPYPGIISVGEYNINITYCFYEPAEQQEEKEFFELTGDVVGRVEDVNEKNDIKYLSSMEYDERNLAVQRLLKRLGW